MKIFEIKRATSYSTKYADFQIADNSTWISEPLFANQYENKHNVPIPYYTLNKYAPTDFPFSDTFLVSEKFLKVIKCLNQDFEALESFVFYKGKNLKAYCEQTGNNDGRIWGVFYTMIFPQFKLFNWEESVYTPEISKFSGEKIVTDLEKLILDKKLIEENYNSISKNNIFVLDEESILLLCTETAKQAIEEAGLTGIAFEEVEVM